MKYNYYYYYTKIVFNNIILLLSRPYSCYCLLRVRQPRAAEVCEGDDILRCGTQFNDESRPTEQYSMAACMRPPGRSSLIRLRPPDVIWMGRLP